MKMPDYCIPDCYDPIYQAEQREREADENAYQCEECGAYCREEFWDILGEILCDSCAEARYKNRVEGIIYV